MRLVTATMDQIAQFDTRTVAADIARVSADYPDYVWGIRFDSPGLPIGHIFPASRVWDDGEVTDDFCDGTSCLAADYVARFRLQYFGTPYIVCGIHAGYGQDSGEILMSECEIMAFVTEGTDK